MFFVWHFFGRMFCFFNWKSQIYPFPTLKVNLFIAVKVDMHINDKIDFALYHVFLTINKAPDVPHHLWSGTHTISNHIVISVNNPQFASFMIAGNRRSFLFDDGSILRLKVQIIYLRLYFWQIFWNKAT